MSIQSEIDRLATVKADLKTAINGASGSTVGDVFGDYPGAIIFGKAAIATAITEKGVATAADATFQQLAENVAAISSGGAESATVSIQVSSVNPDPTYGVHYINTDGIAAYAPLDAETFNLSVKKNTFLLPCMPGDVVTDSLSGDLAKVPYVGIYLDSTGYVTILVQVNGDGAIRG